MTRRPIVIELPDRTQFQTGKPIRAWLTGMTSLVGATVTLVMSLFDDPFTPKIDNASVTVLDASARSVFYQWTDADVDTVGTYRITFWVKYADGTRDPVPDEQFQYKLTINPAPAHEP